MIQVSCQFPISVRSTVSEHWLFFSSDWHLDSPGFDKERFIEQHEEAKARDAHGIFYGDMWELIDVHDKKRYNKAEDQYATEDEMNEALERAWALFEPYVNLYDVVGLGTHEVSALKYKRIDLVRRLVERANKVRDREKRPYPMIHGGYLGLVRYHFKDRWGHYWNVDVFWDHGQGGSIAEISRGEIDLSRFAMWVNADIIALGHKHQHKFSQLPPIASINRAGNLVWRKRRGLITSPYKKNLEPADFMKGGYRRNFEAESFRVPAAAEGGIFAKVDLSVTREPVMTTVTKIRVMEA
jgi:hypothetical protein